MADGQNRDHIVKVPDFYRFLIIAQIFIAVAVLGLAAYGATFNDWFGGNGYAIFCAIAIFLTHGYYLVSTSFFPIVYNCWVFLILSIFQVIWWLSCWADLAAWAAAYDVSFYGVALCDDYSINSEGDIVCLGDRKKHRNVIAAAAGIGALEWILVIVSLVVFAIALHRHRISGAPFTMNGMWHTTPENPRGTPNAVESGMQNGAQSGKAPMQQSPQPQSFQMYPQAGAQQQVGQQQAFQQPVYQQL
ncbi:uncharacterized protein BDR25DRAFT_305683 [Lindgomyces ingoldianus]|uniref:Uncharacterized protein n=1 Tax=Lindgomyces ingoldianus TaxID=673940 RepID=A0ACB6QJT7_9PLEO|nr:uncharacterized protein BDR25DRAFT_305683 [Lindgomyces ingoldianus]KAF2467263.1 hypothetical protein BDR25DRAFT_305683 [Lindgomyces ingoldianus]